MREIDRIRGLLTGKDTRAYEKDLKESKKRLYKDVSLFGVNMVGNRPYNGKFVREARHLTPEEKGAIESYFSTMYDKDFMHLDFKNKKKYEPENLVEPLERNNILDKKSKQKKDIIRKK